MPSVLFSKIRMGGVKKLYCRWQFGFTFYDVHPHIQLLVSPSDGGVTSVPVGKGGVAFMSLFMKEVWPLCSSLNEGGVASMPVS